MDYAGLLGKWGIVYKQENPEIVISGSPERAEFRIVVSDVNDNKYVLERIFKHMLDRKKEIASTLVKLKGEDLSVHPYLDMKEFAGDYWQIMPFIEGISLNRPDYIYEEWRGKVLADFLIKMKSASKGIDLPDFSLKEYVEKILSQAERFQPKHYLFLKKIVDPLSDFFEIKLPRGVCHGDYHPINVIWGQDKINSVIDWEFVGYKDELFDAANLIGCVGMENPQALTKGLIPVFTHRLRDSGLFSSWERLPELVLALRFAWISEWFRKKDFEMQDLEMAYMQLLIDNSDQLRRIW